MIHASDLRRLSLCPKSGQMQEGLPEEDSAASKEGQLLHSHMAHPEYERKVLRPFHQDLLARTEELQKRVYETIGLDRSKVSIRFIETPMKLQETDVVGTPDLEEYWEDTETKLVNDYKFGYKIVEPPDINLQLRVYAVMSWDAHPSDKTYASILQPRLSYDERIRLAVYYEKDIEPARSHILQIIEKSQSKKAKLVAGEEQCRYCKVKLICPAFKKKFGHLTSLVKTEHFWDLSKAAKEFSLARRLKALTDTELEKMLVALSFANMASKLITSEARRRIEAGQLTNYKTAADFEEREIADPQRAFGLLELAEVATREQLYSWSSVPIGKIEEEYRKRTGCAWHDAKDKINRVLSDVIERIPRKGRILRK